MLYNATFIIKNTIEHAEEFLLRTPVDGRDPEGSITATLHDWSGIDQPAIGTSLTGTAMLNWRHAPGGELPGRGPEEPPEG